MDLGKLELISELAKEKSKGERVGGEIERVERDIMTVTSNIHELKVFRKEYADQEQDWRGKINALKKGGFDIPDKIFFPVFVRRMDII